jgi:hypothetical protein
MIAFSLSFLVFIYVFSVIRYYQSRSTNLIHGYQF